MDYIPLEKIIHNECCCIDAECVLDKKCYKRHYVITDWKTNETKQLFICNEYLRCRVNEIKQYSKSQYVDSYQFTDIIHEIITRYVDCNYLYHDFSKNKNDLKDLDICFTVCERPYLFHRVSLLEVIEFCLNDSNQHLFMHHLYDEIKKTITDYMKDLTYKKYKTKYASVKKKLNQLKHLYQDDAKNLMNEIIIEIFEINVKLNNRIL